MHTEKLGKTLETRQGLATAFLVIAALGITLAYSVSVVRAGTGQNSPAAKGDRWIHVRVANKDARGETVSVNVPLELAEKVLPTILHKNFHNGRMRFVDGRLNDVDVRALLEAVSSSRDGEFVTVQKGESDVHVAKKAGYLVVHVREHGAADGKPEQRVEVRMPITVVNALVSGSKDELDLLAGIRALATQPDTELVSVQDRQNTVRIWLDSKNAGD